MQKVQYHVQKITKRTFSRQIKQYYIAFSTVNPYLGHNPAIEFNTLKINCYSRFLSLFLAFGTLTRTSKQCSFANTEDGFLQMQKESLGSECLFKSGSIRSSLITRKD